MLGLGGHESPLLPRYSMHHAPKLVVGGLTTRATVKRSIFSKIPFLPQKINHRGKFTPAFKKEHKSAPELVPWIAGLIKPAAAAKPAAGGAAVKAV